MTFNVMKATNHPGYICLKLNRMFKANLVLKDYLTGKKGVNKTKLKAAKEIT